MAENIYKTKKHAGKSHPRHSAFCFPEVQPTPFELSMFGPMMGFGDTGMSGPGQSRRGNGWVFRRPTLLGGPRIPENLNHQE